MMGKKEKFQGWKMLVAGTLLMGLMMPLSTTLANTFLLAVTADLGLSRTVFTLNSAILAGMGMLVSPFVSKVLNAKTFRWFLGLGTGIYGLGFLLYGLAQSGLFMNIVSIFMGAGLHVATIVPLMVMAHHWFIEKRGLAMSIIMAGIGLGAFVWSPIIGFLLENFGWRPAYFLIGLTILIVCLPLAIFVLRLTPKELGQQPLGSEAGELAEADDEPKGDRPAKQPQFLRQPAFWFLLLGAICIAFANSGGLGHFPPALAEDFSPAQVSLTISLYSVVGMVAKVALGWVSDRYGAFISYTLTLIGISLAFILMMFITVPGVPYLFILAFGLGLPSSTVHPPIVTGQIYEGSAYTSAYGYVNSAIQAGMTTGSLAVAALYDVSGTYDLTWLVLGALCALTWLSWLTAIKLGQSKKLRAS